MGGITLRREKKDLLLLLKFRILIRMDLINFLDVPHSSVGVEIAVVLVAVHWECHFSVRIERKLSNKIMQTREIKLLDLFLALVPVRVLLVYHSPLLVVQHIVMNVYQRRAVLDSVASVDSHPGNSSSGCTISLMAHFRLHHRYRVLVKIKRGNCI